MVLRNNDRRSNGQFQPRRSDKRIFKFKKNNGRWKNTGDQEVFSPFVRAWFQFTVIISAAFREEKTCRSEYSSSVVIIAGSSQHSSRAEPKNIASKKTFGLESQSKDFVRSFHILINIIFHANII